MDKVTTPQAAYTPNERLGVLFEEWRRLPHHGVSDEEMYRTIERESDLERAIAAEAAGAPFQIRHKLDILRDYASVGLPNDNRALVMLASIDADIANLEGGAS